MFDLIRWLKSQFRAPNRSARRAARPPRPGLESLEDRTAPATLTWTGGGATPNWGDRANWGGRAPRGGDSLVFGPGAAQQSSTNNLPGLSLKSITLQDDGYVLGGRPISLTQRLQATDAHVGTSTINLGIGLVGSPTVSVGEQAQITINGKLAGAGQLRKAGDGTLVLTAANTYRGKTTVLDGTLEAANAAGSATGTGGVTVRAGASLTGSGAVRGLVVSAGSGYEVNLDGPQGQLEVRGSVNVAGATLVPTGVFSGGVRTSYTIIDNDGADRVKGTFAGLPEGATVTVNGPGQSAVPYTISYTGGTGNDVVLTTVNSPPTVANPIPNRSGNIYIPFSYHVAADAFADVNGTDGLTYSASGMPAWLSFDPATRTFSGTPLLANVGTATVTVTATDLAGATVSDSFTLGVGGNTAPVSFGFGNDHASVGVPYSYSIAGGMFDNTPGDELTYSVTGLPAWLSYDPESLTLAGTPQAADVGTVTVSVKVTDLAGATATDSFAITVGGNAAPTVANPIQNQPGNANVPFTYQFAANAFADGNSGDVLQYTTSALPAWLSFNPVTRTLSGTPVAANVGTVTITMTATDLAGAKVTDEFDVVIGPNVAPTVANPIANQPGNANVPLSYQFAANVFNDTNEGDVLSYSASGMPAWLSFDPATRTFSGTPLTANVGTVAVTVTATDLSLVSVTDTFDVVIAPNAAPTVANPIPNQTGREARPLSFQFAANAFTDANAGDVLSYSASGMPAWLSFDAATRTFSGTPPAGSAGTVAISVTATDLSGAVVSDSLDLVIAANTAPMVANSIPNQAANVSVPFSYQVAANAFGDADPAETLTYSASGMPAWLSFDPATRTFSGTPPAGSAGTVAVSVTATDLAGASVSDSFDLVVGVNPVPTVTNQIPDQAAQIGVAFNYQVAANAFNDGAVGDVLTYSAMGMPAWMGFNAATRTFSGTPPAGSAGTTAVSVTVTDLAGGTTTDTFNITVSV